MHICEVFFLDQRLFLCRRPCFAGSARASLLSLLPVALIKTLEQTRYSALTYLCYVLTYALLSTCTCLNVRRLQKRT